MYIVDISYYMYLDWVWSNLSTFGVAPFSCLSVEHAIRIKLDLHTHHCWVFSINELDWKRISAPMLLVFHNCSRLPTLWVAVVLMALIDIRLPPVSHLPTVLWHIYTLHDIDSSCFSPSTVQSILYGKTIAISGQQVLEVLKSELAIARE